MWVLLFWEKPPYGAKWGVKIPDTREAEVAINKCSSIPVAQSIFRGIMTHLPNIYMQENPTLKDRTGGD